MKTLVYIAALLLASATVSAQADVDEILASNVQNQGKEQISLSTEEFSVLSPDQLDGIYRIINENNSLQEIRSFRDGELDGTWLQYDDNNRLMAIANYKNNLKHGKWMIWDENGIKRSEMYYENGKRTGEWKQWNEKGELVLSKRYE